MNLASPGVRRILRRAPALVACLLLASASGCGGSSSVGKLYAVSGKVSLGSVSLTQGGVRFRPDPSRGNTSPAEPVAIIQPDGTYTLYTNGKRGAPAGWYKVSVSAGESIDSSKPFSTKSPVARRFTNPETAGLSIEVRPSAAAGAYDLTVTSR